MSDKDKPQQRPQPQHRPEPRPNPDRGLEQKGVPRPPKR